MFFVLFISFLEVHSVVSEPSDQTNWPKLTLFERDQSPLAVDGSWSSWQEWSSCYNNTRDEVFFYAPWENFMVQRRNRTCTDPEPVAGGKDCELPSVRFRQCSCSNPLGLGNGRLKDKQVSASNYLEGYEPEQARLSTTYTGWCAKSRASYLHKPYIQVDFDNFATVGAISIKGNDKGRVKQFKLEYSLNGRVWKNIYTDKDQRNNRFHGNLLPGKIKTNSFDSYKVMKYLRVIPTNTFQLPCLSMELYGCIFSCGKLLTNSFGHITARSSVEHDQSCLWRIEVLNTTSLSFDFNVFYVMCSEGYLDFHDGRYAFTDAPLLSRKCLTNEDEEFDILKLPTNKVWLNFVSNSSSSEVGFNIRYFSECDRDIQLIEGEEYEILSPNYPEQYLDNLNCLWRVKTPTGLTEIKVITNDFSVESNKNSTVNCLGDVVTFEKQTQSGKEKIGSYCNNNKPKYNFTIQSTKLFISFTSDLVASEKGFKFTVLSGEKKIRSTPKTYTGNTNNVVTTANDLSNIDLRTLDTISPFSLPNSNNTDDYKEEIEKEDEDDTWTIIIISIFSAFAIILLAWILGMNIRRFISNRNDLEAHCAKIREQEKKKQKEKLLNEIPSKENQSAQPSGSPKKIPLPLKERQILLVDEPIEKVTNTKQENGLNSPDSIQSHNKNDKTLDSVNIENETDVDGDRDSFDSSSPQIHSPLKMTADDDIELINDGNENNFVTDIENMENIENLDESVL